MNKKILVLGGTGATGRYFVPELLRLGYKTDVVSLDDAVSDNPMLKFIYAGMFNHITDNSKILSITGIKQNELMPLEKELKFEYENSKSIDFSVYADDYRNSRMDAYLQNHGLGGRK